LNAILTALPYRDPNHVVMIWQMPRSPVPPNLTVTFDAHRSEGGQSTMMTGNAIHDLRQGAQAF
jgi:hypothetical protein